MKRNKKYFKNLKFGLEVFNLKKKPRFKKVDNLQFSSPAAEKTDTAVGGNYTRR